MHQGEDLKVWVLERYRHPDFSIFNFRRRNIKYRNAVWGHSLVVECLTCIHDTLGFISSTSKQFKNKGRQVGSRDFTVTKSNTGASPALGLLVSKLVFLLPKCSIFLSALKVHKPSLYLIEIKHIWTEILVTLNIIWQIWPLKYRLEGIFVCFWEADFELELLFLLHPLPKCWDCKQALLIF